MSQTWPLGSSGSQALYWEGFLIQFQKILNNTVTFLFGNIRALRDAFIHVKIDILIVLRFLRSYLNVGILTSSLTTEGTEGVP